MKQLSDTALRQLAASERATLAMVALARGDGVEVKRLVNTCPEGAEFLDYQRKAGRLFDLGMALECEGRGMVIELLLARWHGVPADALACVARIKSAAEHWRAFAEAEGLDPADLCGAASGQPSIWLAWSEKLQGIKVPSDQEVALIMSATLPPRFKNV